jgi:glycosyltransferase involved in cell wall biosynthesis
MNGEPALRLIVYFRGSVSENRGTPLRCRHLTSSMLGQPGVEALLVSRDEPSAIERILPGLAHSPVAVADQGLSCLVTATRSFQPDVVYAHTHKGMADLSRLAVPGVARVADLHGDLPAWRLEQSWRPWPWRIYRYLHDRWRERRDLPAMDALTVVSGPLEDRARAFGKPVTRLWGGTDVERFDAPQPPPRETLVIAYAGNFNPYHGILTMVDAVRLAVDRGRGFRLTLIGAIDEFPEVRRRAEEMLGDRVECVGPVPYEDVPHLLQEADILVMPRARSRTAVSTYPSKLSDYLATARPVVASDVGEVREVVSHGDNGLLAAAGSAEEMASAFELLLDRETRVKIGAAGRRTAADVLSWEQIAKRAVGFLREAVANQRSPGR